MKPGPAPGWRVRRRCRLNGRTASGRLASRATFVSGKLQAESAFHGGEISAAEKAAGSVGHVIVEASVGHRIQLGPTGWLIIGRGHKRQRRMPDVVKRSRH